MPSIPPIVKIVFKYQPLFFPLAGVPLKPRREMSFVEDLEGHVKVVWVSKFNVSVEPVIYMLQSRWNIGIHPSEDHASPWTTVATVTNRQPFTLGLSLRICRFKILRS